MVRVRAAGHDRAIDLPSFRHSLNGEGAKGVSPTASTPSGLLRDSNASTAAWPSAGHVSQPASTRFAPAPRCTGGSIHEEGGIYPVDNRAGCPQIPQILLLLRSQKRLFERLYSR